MPATDLIRPPGGGPASVTPRCSGYSTVCASRRYDSTIEGTLLCFTEIFMSWKPTSSSSRISWTAESTSACGTGAPYLSRRSLSSDPAFTPTRIGTPASSAAVATALMCSGLRMLPGLSRNPATPASSAASASRYWKWMSAMMGTGALGTISASPWAASTSLQVMRTMSAPAPLRA